MTATVGDVTVVAEYDEGTLPEGAAMAVTPLNAEPYTELVTDATGRTDTELLTYDITFLAGDEIVEPEGNVKISFQADFINETAEPEIVHITDDGSAALIDGTVTEGAVSGLTDSFSVYALSYTVDFHWEVNGEIYELSLPGGGFVSFSQLAEALGLAETGGDEDNAAEEPAALEVRALSDVAVSEQTWRFVSDVDTLVFSNPELMSVSKVETDTRVGAIKDSLGLECQYAADLTLDEIARINITEVRGGDWALISLKPFLTEETLTVTMKNGDVFEILVTDAQASDPYGLDGQTFVIANNNQAMQSSLNSGGLSSGNVSGATTDAYKWTIAFDKDAFNGAGGYYLMNSGGKYIRVENGAISFTDKEKVTTTVVGGETVQQTTILATPFRVSFNDTNGGSNSNINQGKERGAYRFSTNANSNGGFLTLNNNNRFTIGNTASNSTWMLLRQPSAPTTMPGTVGTWDIVSDEIELKMFDYSGTVTTYVQDGGWWEDWDQNRWYLDEANGNWYGSRYINGQWITGNWVTGEWHPNYVETTRDIDAVWGSNTNETQLRSGTGVNAGRTIVFSGSGLSGQAGYNNFTGSNTDGSGGYYSGYVYQNIVKHNLGTDDYPALAVTIPSAATADTADGGSLGYLFGSKNSQDGVAVGGVTAYTNGGTGLNGLLRKDADGYYYYDSEENYARMNADNSEILLYSDTYNKDAGSSNVKKEKIGFFPFTDMNTADGEEKGPAKVQSGGQLYYNHQFGMSMETPFVYPDGGVVPDTGKEMIFEFSGDDDVWVFVDGVLLLDLGGVHQPIHGIINFATGAIDIYEYNSSGVEYKSDKSTTIDQMFAAASAEAGETKTFDRSDFSSHKLSFFYLERGGCDSNLAMKFNLLVNKSLTVAKKLNGLTPTERQKYMNDWFLYELALRHNARWNDSGVDIDLSDDAAVWENADRWRTGFQNYSTDFNTVNEAGNFTQYTQQDGSVVKGYPIQNGQIYLKAGESMTVSRLPRTDIFYLAEENELDMAQFETPHAERLFVDASDSSRHEEEVHLHEDRALYGNEADWETKPYALMDTERVVYTNTIQEKNLDVRKLWEDEDGVDRPDQVKFKLVATVDGEPYQTVTGHDTINAQWTETRNSVTTTHTANVIDGIDTDFPFRLDAGNNWHISFEHLPKMTESATGTGKEIIYSVVEDTPEGYSVEYDGPTDTKLAYLDLFKFWPDDNSNHNGSSDEKKAEHIYAYVRRSDGKYIVASRDTNGEYVYVDAVDANQDGTPPNQATPILLTAKSQLQGNTSYHFNMNTVDQYEMFDYASRVNNVPLAGGTEDNPVTYTYSLVEPVDEDTTTTGLVLFTRSKREIDIRNSKGQIEVRKQWQDADGNPIRPGDGDWVEADMNKITYTVYQLKHEHEWIVPDPETEQWVSVTGSGWYVAKVPTEAEPGIIRRVCRFDSCGHHTEEAELPLDAYNPDDWTVSTLPPLQGGGRNSVTDQDLTEAILLSDLELTGLGVKNPGTGDTLLVYGEERTMEMTDANLVEGEDALWHTKIAVPLKDGDGTVYEYYVVENMPVPGGDYIITYAGQSQGLHNNGVATIYNRIRPVEVQIIKTDANTGASIGGAVFSIQSDHQNLSLKPESGKLVVVDAGTEGAVTEFTVPTGGITVSGLSSGTYTLLEQAAPAGYIITNSTTTFTIRNGKIVMNDEELDELTVSIPNTPGAELPATGGAGTSIFYLFGTLMALGAISILIARRNAIV